MQHRRFFESTYKFNSTKINNIYVDRGFFNCKIINLLNEMGMKFLMPAVKNKRIMKLANEFDSPKVIEYRIGVTRSHKGKRKFREDSSYFNLVIVDDEDGIKRTFATNLDVEEKDAFGLFGFTESVGVLRQATGSRASLSPRLPPRIMLSGCFTSCSPVVFTTSGF